MIGGGHQLKRTKGTPLITKTFSFGHCPNYPPLPPIQATCTTFFGRQKRITEPSNDFGVKNDQKVSHNMILISKYKGQHGGKRVKKIGQGPPPSPFRAMPEIKGFLL